MTVDSRKLRLGSRVVQRLLPHRPPMLFVDFVAGYERGPRPALRAGRHISANEGVFTGHFPQFPIWPGVYTLEGLNQACNLLAVISAAQSQWEAAGHDPGEVLDALRHLDEVFDMKAPLRGEKIAPLGSMLEGEVRVGFSVSVDARFTAPVFGGTRLDYTVEETMSQEAAMRYDVEALVDGSPVAKGRLMLSRARAVPRLP